MELQSSYSAVSCGGCIGYGGRGCSCWWNIVPAVRKQWMVGPADVGRILSEMASFAGVKGHFTGKSLCIGGVVAAIQSIGRWLQYSFRHYQRGFIGAAMKASAKMGL